MSVPELAVRRPVTVLMAAIAVAVFGTIAASNRPVELLPSISHPTLTVQTEYPDAAPVTVEQFVTQPIEEAVGVISGVRGMQSVSRAGLSEVVLRLEWGEPADRLALDVREKLGVVTLPPEAEAPRVLRYDPSLEPVVRLALRGPWEMSDLRELADRFLKPKLEAVEGVAAAKVRGGLDPEIEVQVDPQRLASFGITLDDVAQAIRSENVNRPGGTITERGSVFLVRTLNELDDLDELRRIVVRESEAGRVRVEDVATVERGHAERVEETRLDGIETVEIALYREGDANLISVAQNVRAELDVLGERLDTELELSVLADQSVYVEKAVQQVWSAALVGGLLAVLVLYFFLRDLRSTAIVAVTIPASVVAVFLPLQQLDVTINIMSLGGLALGVGMLVDNAIVVLEAIDRRRRLGDSRIEAAMRGASEVAGAVTAATATTVAVFLPIVFVEGVAGQLFRDLALTVCLSLAASLVVALSVIPALAGVTGAGALGRRRATLFPWDRSDEDEPHGEPEADRPWTLRLGPLALPPVGNGRHWFSKLLTILLFPVRLVVLIVAAAVVLVARALGRLFDVVAWPLGRLLEGLGRAYPAVLRGALRARWLVIAVAFLLFGAALHAGSRLPTELVPDLARGEFAFRLALPEGTPLSTTSEVVGAIERPLVGDERFSRVFSVIGSLPSGSASGRRTTGENLAQLDFVLAAGARQDEGAAVQRVRDVLAAFPQVDAELVRPTMLQSEPPVVVEVHADELEDLDEAAQVVAERLGRLPGLSDVTTTIEPGSPEIRVRLDRERAAALGVDSAAVGSLLRGQVRGELVGNFREGERRLPIRLRVREDARRSPEDIAALELRLEDGVSIPISSIASIEVARGPATIHRTSGSRVARVSASAPAAGLGETLARVEREVRALPLPDDVVAELAGQDEELERSLASLRFALALAIFLVYVVMAMQFESLLHPFVILLAVPLGVVGVVAALLLTGTALGVLVLMGSVMLAGIVVNNAIVLVDAINRRRREGERLEVAIVGAGRERLRPILMTTATTVLGLLPLALGLGAGDELRRPLAIAVIGGLTAATVLTLVVTPCLYRALTRPRSAEERLPAGAGEPAGAAS